MPTLFDHLTAEGKSRHPTVRRFERFHELNPHIYTLFKRFTFEARAAGHTHFSGQAIIERIRWETTVVTRGDDFKCNNDWVSLYARMLMTECPELAGFFRTRRVKFDERDVPAAKGTRA